MKAFEIVVKLVTALVAVAGAVYVVATYGDKIVAWAKNLISKCPCEITVTTGGTPAEEEAPAEEAAEEAPAAEEVSEEAPAAEEATEEEAPAAAEVPEESAPVADESDFVG